MRRYESMSDDQLVHLYSAGTNEAFDTLLLRYDAYVHTTIRYWVTDEDLVEDIFQDTFIKTRPRGSSVAGSGASRTT